MKKNFNPTISIGMILILFLASFLMAGETRADSKQPTGDEEQNRAEQAGPPWLDEGWHYRLPLIITNTSTYLSYYQVLITLDESTFDFTLAKADGSDIRITDSSGKNLISFWIESWDSQNKSAYVWVLVAAIPPEPYSTTIYLYYGNPAADTASYGLTTFDFFDHFSQFSGIDCHLSSIPQEYQPFSISRNHPNPITDSNDFPMLTDPWCVISGSPSISSGILILNNSTGIKSNNLFQFQAVGYRANYGLGSGNKWAGYINGTSGAQTVIGDLAVDPDSLYLINFLNDNSAPLGPNNWHNAYHIYELRWKNGLSEAYLDHTYQALNASQVPTRLLPLTLYNNDSSSGTTLKVDWVYVRQYRFPEPEVEPGREQRLVDLELSIVDFPDPLPKNAELSYLLTITNNSNIDAHEVVVTDTLPASVNFLSVNPTEGCNVIDKDIACNLGSIAANSFTSVTIVGKTTIDDVITDTAWLTSFDYDLDMSNNVGEQATLVDSVAPTATWVLPTTYGLIYTSYGGWVTLEVSASDNDQIDNVEFWWYSNGYNLIGKISAPPYRTTFNTNLLQPGMDYFFEVRAYDRAGNSNFPLDRVYIYIRRSITTFLPVVSK